MAAINAPLEINYPYNAIDLTSEINRIPNVWQDLPGLYKSEYPVTRFVEIQFKDGLVTVLEADELGGNGPESAAETENGIILKIPYIPHMEHIRPEDLQDRYVFESGRRRLLTLADANADALMKLRRNHAQTLEFLKWGALKGQLVSGLGVVLYDFFELFGIQKQSFDLLLGTATTDVLAICESIREYLETNLKGESMTGIRCIMGSGLWTRFTRHTSVEKYYIQSTAAQALAGQIANRTFEFGGITFSPNYHTVSNLARQPVRFVDNAKAIVFPLGTENTFRTFFGPSYHISQVNTAGAEVFVTPKVLDHGMGIELKSQSNPLPVCQRPELLVELTSSN